MANLLPSALKQTMKASGGAAPVWLVEMQTLSGRRIFISDHALSVVPVLAEFDGGTPAPVPFLPWLTKPPTIHTYKNLTSSSGSISIQNISGNTVSRDAASLFAAEELWGALVYLRLYREDAEYALREYLMTTRDPGIEADGPDLSIGLEGFANWNKVRAPDGLIEVSCNNIFASVACGSTALVACNNSYGSCTSIERFSGFISQWNGNAFVYTQVAQPAPSKLFNPVIV